MAWAPQGLGPTCLVPTLPYLELGWMRQSEEELTDGESQWQSGQLVNRKMREWPQPTLVPASCRMSPLASLSYSSEWVITARKTVIGGKRRGEDLPGPCLTRGGQPLLSRVSRVHRAVTEQGPSLGPALSPTWHVVRAQPQEGWEEQQ